TYLAWRKQGGAAIMAAAPAAAMESAANQMVRYVISRGDTLTSIAKRNNVSAGRLREVNGFRSDQLRFGQVIHIPGSRLPFSSKTSALRLRHSGRGRAFASILPDLPSPQPAPALHSAVQ